MPALYLSPEINFLLYAAAISHCKAIRIPLTLRQSTPIHASGPHLRQKKVTQIERRDQTQQVMQAGPSELNGGFMSAADQQGTTRIDARRRLRPGRTATSLACAAFLLLAAGCATTRRTPTAPSAGAVSGLPQVPAGLRRGAESGNAGAEVAMGLRESAIGRYAAANSWYRKAALQGSLSGEINLADDYETGKGMTRNYARANFWFRQAAERDDAEGETALAYALDTGRGIARSYTAAVHWLRLAAEQRYAPAEYSLGYAYFNGHGVTINHTTANLWYRRAAEQGYALGEDGLGYDYELGLGTAPDLVAAHRWFLEAARQGLAGAELDVAADYEFGRGIARNDARAVLWLRKAAEQGLPAAQYFLGAEYSEGHGTTRNMSKATYWLDKASAAGFSPPQNDAACLQNARKIAAPKARGDTMESATVGRHSGYTPPSMKTGFPLPCGFYPVIAQLLHKQGTALVRVCIGKNGRLLHKPTITRSSGSSRLDAAALRYASATSGHWRPERHDGVPINFCAQLPVRFAMTASAPAIQMPGRPGPTPRKRLQK